MDTDYHRIHCSKMSIHNQYASLLLPMDFSAAKLHNAMHIAQASNDAVAESPEYMASENLR